MTCIYFQLFVVWKKTTKNGSLGLKLKVDTLLVRAHKISVRLICSGKIHIRMVIISYKSDFKVCTILLMSRDRVVFDQFSHFIIFYKGLYCKIPSIVQLKIVMILKIPTNDSRVWRWGRIVASRTRGIRVPLCVRWPLGKEWNFPRTSIINSIFIVKLNLFISTKNSGKRINNSIYIQQSTTICVSIHISCMLCYYFFCCNYLVEA